MKSLCLSEGQIDGDRTRVGRYGCLLGKVKRETQVIREAADDINFCSGSDKVLNGIEATDRIGIIKRLAILVTFYAEIVNCLNLR